MALIFTVESILKLESIVPLVFNLTNLFTDTPEYVENSPPTTILSSDCIFISKSYPLLKPVPIVNVLSILPSVFNLIILFLDTPEYDVKVPAANIFESDCMLTSVIVARLLKPVPILNVLSTLPSLFNLIILLLVTPEYDVK